MNVVARPRLGLMVSGILLTAGVLLLVRAAVITSARAGQNGAPPFTDFTGERPGSAHRIAVSDLPRPYLTASADNPPQIVARPPSAWPQAPSGFTVDQYVTGLSGPRMIRTAPNGDVFVVESGAGRVRVLHEETDGARRVSTFATGLSSPFGVAFYPPESDPQFVYVANTESVVRFPYVNGDLEARGSPEVVLASLTPAGQSGGHWTRDIAFSRDGLTMYVSVGSLSNVDDTDNNPAEVHRADILQADPQGEELTVYAWGIRNPVGLAVDPATGDVWTSVNERDGLGDNLPPDYITRVQPGGFYGWPWYYIGAHQDPRLAGKHPELKDRVIVPDVLLQPHNASLGLTIYNGAQFPVVYRGDIFAAEHGSWNRGKRTGYEVIRVRRTSGRATGQYEDFLTGFVTANGQVWGRPVAVTVARDGSLLVTDDASDTVWRVRYSVGVTQARP